MRTSHCKEDTLSTSIEKKEVVIHKIVTAIETRVLLSFSSFRDIMRGSSLRWGPLGAASIATFDEGRHTYQVKG